MTLVLFFQIPILFFLSVAAYRDYKTRIVSNDIILYVVTFSLPITISHIADLSSFLIPVVLCFLFLVLFYLPEKIDNINISILANSIGGADTKVFIPLLLSMTTNEIFIFFLLFTISNIILIIRFWKGIPLFISILFGYFGVILLSSLPIFVRMVFGT